MAEAGLRVLAYDQPCVGESDCDISDRAGLQRAVATLETAGASRIFVIAASAGGEAAITAAADPELDLASAVALSPVGAVQRVRFRTSLLIAGDPADSYLDLASLRAVTRAAPSLVDLRLVRGGGHAQELLHSGDAAGGPSEFRRELLEFLRNA
jgi:pimeloyl-ACP methyl ester carboxylesterase